ncbi:MAG: deoxyguanosinetriphosphate triphosphohydrolase [Gammaproteobacteria bacterium]|nr:deoxyguanosinetriphosphate triphosphohydrolase [Gammaproteobacteria bacterium]|tara:strand:- start:462 stop:1589 length:1128 start_codon:yes stop_codon:yes gene_type:complete
MGEILAPYAVNEACSRGRKYSEPRSKYRGEFQRDRDRIIHSTGFRRLVYKTQVFINHEGDLYRTRLTHSLEVSQIGRTVATSLRLNEALTEAICLAHDIGHTPFGHAGQDTLNACMHDFGGFEHNLQSLRIVDVLESKYADFNGLNLMFETREGILKHCSSQNAQRLGDVGKRFLEGLQPSLEAQVANIVDEIAYNSHDVDDGFRSGLLNIEQLRTQSLFAKHFDIIHKRYPELDDRRLIYEIIRSMIGAVVDDLIRYSSSNINRQAPRSIEDVRRTKQPLIAMSDSMYEQHIFLKRFLRKNLYSHEQKLEMTKRVQTIINDLFHAYMKDEKKMPLQFASAAKNTEKFAKARIVTDYIAGMTDRYAIAAHEFLNA